MKNGKLGYAVVGLGIGKAHVDAAINNPKCTLVAVCDLIREKLDKVVEKSPETLIYTDYDEVLKNPDIDIVSVCVPSGMHADFAVRAMEAGKHVLCEKPIELTVERAMPIEEARIRTGKKAGIIFQNRNNACMRPMKEAIDSGRIGRVFCGTFAVKWYRDDAYYEGWHGTWDMDGGGSLINQSVHTVDLMQWLLGDVESVTSEMRIVDHDIETEDFTASLIRFRSGAVATFVSTTCAYPGICTAIQVYGTGGSMEADGDSLTVWKMRDADDDEEEDMLERYGQGNRMAAVLDPSFVAGHQSMVNDIIDAVLEDRDPQIMPMEAMKAVRIINAVYESAKTGKTVYFD
ncbi:MAG: Gfo/Idh/MocA family protein [Eubacteriales bacterium]